VGKSRRRELKGGEGRFHWDNNWNGLGDGRSAAEGRKRAKRREENHEKQRRKKRGGREKKEEERGSGKA